ADAPAVRGPGHGGEPVHPGGPLGRQPGRAAGHRPDHGAAALLRMARPGLHLALRAADAARVRPVRRRAAVQGARCAGRRPEGLPVRRGAQGRAQALGVQGVRHRLHPGDPDRHLHGLPRGRLRGLLQLRPPQPPAGEGGDPVVSTPGWVDAALREHEEQAARDAGAGPLQPHPRDERNPGAPQPAPGTVREEQVLARIDRARRSRPRVKEPRITMSHGAGGKASRTLVEAVFLDAFRNPLLEPMEDAARLEAGGASLAFTTDSFVVSPLFFPGGDIGDLAVNGTVNDLAMCGARPLYLSWGFILEEGFPVAALQRIVRSMADAAARAGVQIVTGDTKVVERGKADGCYITTAGVGALDRDTALGPQHVRAGDAVIVSGPIGEHGMTIMLARGELDIEASLVSDTAPVSDLVAAMLEA